MFVCAWIENTECLHFLLVTSFALYRGSSKFAAKCILLMQNDLLFFTISTKSASSFLKRGVTIDVFSTSSSILFKNWITDDKWGSSPSTVFMVLAIGKNKRWRPSTFSQKNSFKSFVALCLVKTLVTNRSSSIANDLNGCLFNRRLFRHSTYDPHLERQEALLLKSGFI